eukprot:IDg12076t1
MNTAFCVALVAPASRHKRVLLCCAAISATGVMEAGRVRKTRSSTRAAATPGAVSSDLSADAPVSSLRVRKSKKAASSGKKADKKAKKPTSARKLPTKVLYDVERDEEGRAYFYFRSEPTTRMQKGVDVKFSYDDLLAEPDSTAHWDGVRNHAAKNWMLAMRVGDRGLFYHSNAAAQTGIVGVVEVVKEAYPDHTAWDKNDP